MPNVLVVTLTAKGLTVDQSGGHHWVRRKSGAQEIYWVLSGEGLAHARFVVPGRKRKPGFAWAQGAPPARVFGKPRLLAGGRVLAVRVAHEGAQSEGWWKYVIRVHCCDEEFATELTDGEPDFEPPPDPECEPGTRCGPKRQRMVHDPVIINR
jgi:hypothetical protein